ncbi:MAG: hypothetical protein ACK5JD_06500 [Mangrovibacterium sp.]
MTKRQNYLLGLALLLTAGACQPNTPEMIDRQALVTRNNVEIAGFDSLSSLSVGNGNFAFTTDLTGLQTFYKDYENGVPLGTQSNWGWHSNPNAENYQWSETLKYWDVQGRMVPYRHQLKDNPRANAACDYFRENPHRLHLGMLGLKLTKTDGTDASLADIKNARHSLDMWTGKISSTFEFEGEPVKVETYCHQQVDEISTKIESPLIAKKQLAVQLKFSAGVAENTDAGYDFNSPEKHQSSLRENTANDAKIHRQLDTTNYEVELSWVGDAALDEAEAHTFILQAKSGGSLEVNCLFAPSLDGKLIADFASNQKNNHEKWPAFWQSGGAIDFSGCTDPRAKELERRTVLSQYLVQIQSSGDLPPAETGLTYNSWYGKYHLEMHWWHMAHFAQWNRPEYMLKQMDYYNVLYAQSEQTAKEQGYKGVRWPKMIGPDGENSPSSVGSYLIWQQPHIIWFAEQIYRANPGEETIDRFKKLVFATADFMADFPVWSELQQQYNLEPPLIPAQEHWSRETTQNPPFELAYWHWALSIAQQWKERAGEARDNKWDDVRQKMATPSQADGLYLGIQGATDSYTNPAQMEDHPVVLGAYGILPAWDKLDPEVMRKTMHVIAERWDWPSTWGWDYPMATMSAVRLGEPELALEFLLKDVQKNTYLKNGHNYQSERLRIYLPGNGGFLTTIAMMCAGWEGCTETNPGFPKDGKWNVKWENLQAMF